MKPLKYLSKAILTPIVLALIAVICLSGCVNATNPVTGQTYQTIDPNIAAKIDKIADRIAVAIPVAAGGFAIFPWLTLVTGIAGGALAAWKKYSGDLKDLSTDVVTQSNKSQLYYNTITSIATGVENFKKSNPVEWETLKKTLSDTIGKKAEAVIDGVRDSITGKIA